MPNQDFHPTTDSRNMASQSTSTAVDFTHESLVESQMLTQYLSRRDFHPIVNGINYTCLSTRPITHLIV